MTPPTGIPPAELTFIPVSFQYKNAQAEHAQSQRNPEHRYVDK